ncbi:MAG: sigma-70 family RNA polymerase sigma factor [Pirellulales bacterium]
MRNQSNSDTADEVAQQPSSTQPHKLEPTRWLERYGDLLYNFAYNRLRQHELGEDTVQNTLVSAYRKRHNFRGDASERTWLLAILKRKIYDSLRCRWETLSKVSLTDEADSEEMLFDNDGSWRENSFADIRDNSEPRELRDIVLKCLHKLPRVQAAIFMMRVLQEKNSEEICKELDLSPSTYWTRFHRARIGLARCVSNKWSIQ